MEKNIVYKKRDEIDIAKWEACIKTAPNGLIYASYWWLDIMADNWDALVLGDYEIVMPLTWRRKWGIKYLYQPAFTQQTGIISTSNLNETQVESFLAIARKHFHFAEINLNFKNKIKNAGERNNFILDLSLPYEEIRKDYKPDLQRNLAKGRKQHLQYKATANVGEILALYKKTYWNRRLGIKENDLDKLGQLITVLQKKEMLQIRATYTNDGDLCTVRLCPKDANRIYFLVSATPATSRQYSGNHFLTDQLIKEFSEQNILLDCEGSDLKGVAEFYRNFGVTNQPYYFVKWNNLPWPISIIKK